jgi:hypothetical protein
MIVSGSGIFGVEREKRRKIVEEMRLAVEKVLKE